MFVILVGIHLMVQLGRPHSCNISTDYNFLYTVLNVFLLRLPSIHPVPSDYQAGPYSVTFPAGSTTAAVNIPIQSDNVLEGTENFTATISTANTGFPSVTAGDDDTATINIQEDACAYQLHVHVVYL